MVKSMLSPNLTAKQIVLALREASTRMDCRVFFKSIGLIACNELNTMKHMLSNCNKFIKKTLKTDSWVGRVSNEKKEKVNALFLAFASMPRDDQSSDEDDKKTFTIQKKQAYDAAFSQNNHWHENLQGHGA